MYILVGTKSPSNPLWRTTTQSLQGCFNENRFTRSSSSSAVLSTHSRSFTASFTSPELTPGEVGYARKQRREALKHARERAERKLEEKKIERAKLAKEAEEVAFKKREKRRLKREEARLRYHLKVVAVEVIQRIFRGYRARQRLKEMVYKQQNNAAFVIQRLFIAVRERAFGRIIREQKLQEKIRNIKVILLQNCWRNYLARMDARSKMGAMKMAKEREARREMHRIQTGATILIQAYVRGMQSRMLTKAAVEEARNIDQNALAKERLQKENGTKPVSLATGKGHAFMRKLGNKKVERRWKRKEDIRAKKEAQEAEGEFHQFFPSELSRF